MGFDFQLLENAGIQLIDGDRGKNYPKHNDFMENGYCLFLSAKNVTKSGFQFQETAFINETKDCELKAGKLKYGDIVLTTRGTVGNVAYYDSNNPYKHIRINSGMIIIRSDSKLWNPKFLYFILTSAFLQEQIVNLISGSAVPQLPARDIKKFILPVISKNIQDKISNVISALNDKISVNIDTNQTLEQMSQTLFKSWFVDFDPVIDNALDAGNPIPEALQSRAELRQKVRNSADFTPLSADIRALFPAEFEETELGWVPKGWDIVKTEDIAIKIGMGPFGSNIKVSTFVDCGVPVISGQHLKEILIIDGGNNFITPEHAEKLKNSAVYRKDIIFTHAGNIGQVSIIHDDSEYEDYIISQRQFYLRVNESKSSPYYLIHYFRSEQGQHALLSNASQVGVPSIARPSTHLRNITFLNPSKPLLEEFDKLCAPLFKRFNQNRKCSISLTTLRDTLLPKLISGELSLEDLPDLVNQTEPA
ncbi:restriction endonuclease subunit S [Salmonella enterica subsp. salamae serovar 4,12:e,n,x:1,6]|nr:restriction endonuclease subunit S [Salmonella enterica subsp. salamae serovar 4,12:e,n,x:1,6]